MDANHDRTVEPNEALRATFAPNVVHPTPNRGYQRCVEVWQMLRALETGWRPQD